jgi:hypothetical protein
MISQRVKIAQGRLITVASVVAVVLWGCGIKTTPSVFETRLNSYITAVPTQDRSELAKLWVELDEDLRSAPERGDAKLYALKSEVAREIALLEILNGADSSTVEARKYITASLRDGGVAYLLSEWSEQSPDWIKPAVYNIAGDLLTIGGLSLDRQYEKSKIFSDAQRKENFTRAAMYHLGALAFHLQSKTLSAELLKAATAPSPGLKLQASKSDERRLETLSRAINDLGEVLSSSRRLQIMAEAENGRSDVFLSHFNFSPQTHYLTGFLFSERATESIEKKDVNGCLATSGLAARHYAVAVFFAAKQNEEYEASLGEAVTRFLGCLDL